MSVYLNEGKDDDLWTSLVLAAVCWIVSWLMLYLKVPEVVGIAFILFLGLMVSHLFFFAVDTEIWDIALSMYGIAGIISTVLGGWAVYQVSQGFEFCQLWLLMVGQIVLLAGSLFAIFFLRTEDKTTRYFICSNCDAGFTFENSEQCPVCQEFDTREVSEEEYEAFAN
jgi:hypothetical protein